MTRVFFLTLLFAATANAATISGTVADESNQPLAAMTIAAYSTAGVLQSSGATTPSGTYTLTLPAGTYHVLAYDPAGTLATSFYADAESFETSATLTLTSAQNATNINFRLVRAGVAAGRVTDSAGAALANMTVTAYNLSGTRRGFTTTDAAGNFKLSLPPGSYKVAAFDDALTYATTFFDDATSFDAAATLSIAAGATVTTDLQLPPAAKLTGVVTDRTTTAPIGAVRVTAYDAAGNVAARTLTSSAGRYAVAVRPGSVRVVVDDPAGNYATTYVPDAESFSTAPAITADTSVTINATMTRAAHLAGRVADRVSGAPLAGITAVAYNADGTTRALATTSAAGTYSIVVPPGDYRLGTFDATLVYLPQFYANQPLFTGATVTHAIAQQTTGGFDFALAKGARVTGHVTSRTLGTPLGNITVGAYDVNGHLLASATSDASGAYTLLVAPATVKILAFDSALQFATAYYLGAQTFDTAPSLSLAEAQSLTADFALPDAGRITGTVRDAASIPLAGIEVLVYDTSFRTIAETTTDATGTFRVAVPPGTYTVAAADTTHRYGATTYGSMVNVAAHADVGPLQLRLTVASRRRAASH